MWKSLLAKALWQSSSQWADKTARPPRLPNTLRLLPDRGQWTSQFQEMYLNPMAPMKLMGWAELSWTIVCSAGCLSIDGQNCGLPVAVAVGKTGFSSPCKAFAGVLLPFLPAGVYP